MKNYYPEDVEVYTVKGWIIRYSPSEKTLYCKTPMGRVHIITPDTYIINSLPQYVKDFLNHKGLLKTWREAQQQKALDRLIALRKATEKKDGKYVTNLWINSP